MFCFVLTSPPLMLCVYLQTFEAALFWKKKKKKKFKILQNSEFHSREIIFECILILNSYYFCRYISDNGN